MLKTIVAYPRIGEKRELKFLVEGYINGEITEGELEEKASLLRIEKLKYLKSCKLEYIPVNDFSYYDRVLDTAVLFGIIGSSMKEYFSCADKMPMKKWFNTNYHYIQPEYKKTELKLNTHKIEKEYLEAKSLGIEPKVTVIGPYTFLYCMNLDKIDGLIEKYAEMIKKLSDMGVKLVQLEEPVLTMKKFSNIQEVYNKIARNKGSLEILVQTYYEGLGLNYHELLKTNIDAIGLDFVNTDENFFVIQKEKNTKKLFCGLVDTQTVFRDDIHLIQQKIATIRKYASNILISSSTSLIHLPYTIKNEKDDRFKNLAFAKEKIDILVNIQDKKAKEYVPKKDKAKRRITKYTEYTSKIKEDLVFSTIGSFPQTKEVRDKRREWNNGDISKRDYVEFIQKCIKNCVKLQEDVGVDILVHGEFERSDMVYYFAEKLDGFLIGENSWVQSYGTRCVKPPIIYSDIKRREEILRPILDYTKSLTKKKVKAILTGPNTILAWSYVRKEDMLKALFQISRVLNYEVRNISDYVQIDEPALIEKMPIRKEKQKEYISNAIKAFRMVIRGKRKNTKVLSHLCYSDISKYIWVLNRLGVDAFLIESKKSNNIIDKKISFVLGLGVYDVHSRRIPSVEEIRDNILEAKKHFNILWINPDCGLKTRNNEEVKKALLNIRKAIDTLNEGE